MKYAIGAAVVVVLLIVLVLIGYVKAPPDTAYMISGFRKPRILIGKAGIRIPVLERLDKLSLKMFSVDVKTTDNVPNAENINEGGCYCQDPHRSERRDDVPRIQVLPERRRRYDHSPCAGYPGR